MKRSQRLNPIKNLAQGKEKDAAQALGQSLNHQKNETNKLEQLKQYRLEYLQQMERKITQGINGSTLHQYHQFLDKLDLAITQQQQAVEQSDLQLLESRQQWQIKRGKAKAISQAMDTMAQHERQVQEKRESVQADEMSTQAFLRRINCSN